MGDLTWRSISLISVSVLLFLSCLKEETRPLPAKTHEGRNTFGYYGYTMDTTYISKDWLSGDDSIYLINEHELVIHDQDAYAHSFWTGYDYADLQIYFKKTLNDPNFVFDQVIFDDRYSSSSDNYYGLTNSSENYCFLSYDNQEDRIVSGSFEFHFVLIDSGNGNFDTLGITASVEDGRFDLRY